jgi:hypothetical protein
MVQGCTLRGSGNYTSLILPSTSGQTVFTLTFGVLNYANIEIFGLQILSNSGVSDNTQTGITCVLCNGLKIHDMVFTGLLHNVILDRGYDSSIVNVISQGLGGTPNHKAGNLQIYSSVDTDHIFNTVVTNYHVYNNGTGVNGPLLYLRRAVVTLVTSFVNNDASVGGSVDGIVMENDCQGVKLTGVTIAAPNSGIILQTGSGVNVPPSFITISSIDIDQAQSLVGAINIANGQYITIQGGNITSSGISTTGNGIRIAGGGATPPTAFVNISGMNVNGYNGAGGSGIIMAGNLNHVNIVGNTVTTNTSGVGIVAGGSDFINISGNNLSGNTLGLNATAITGTHNVFTGNLGVPTNNLNGTLTFGTSPNTVPVTGTPTVSQATCVKSAGPPVVIGYCSTVVSAGGACTCN